MLPRRDTLALEEVVPDNAVGIAQTPGTSWTWSNWAQLTAGLSYPFLLTHLSVQLSFYVAIVIASTLFEPLHIQVGKGASGSEEVIGETAFGSSVLLTGTTPSVTIGTVLNLPLTPTIIPANTRLAVRSSEKYSTALFSLRYYLYGYNATKYSLPLYFKNLKEIEQLLKGVKTKLARVYPIAGLSNNITSGAAWTWGSWTEIIASMNKDALITGMLHVPISTLAYHLQIGVGVAGSEQAMSKIVLPGLISIGFVHLPRPLLMKKGERVSVRNKSSLASRVSNISLIYYELT